MSEERGENNDPAYAAYTKLVNNKDITSSEVKDAYKDWADQFDHDNGVFHPNSEP